jgi:hypothetical protein
MVVTTGEYNLPCFVCVNGACLTGSYLFCSFFLVFFCDPLGDNNIWSTLYPRFKAEEKNGTVVVVAARLEGTSMFDGLVPGAMSPVTGIVTLLMTAKILASVAQHVSDIDSHQGELYNCVACLRN